MLNKPDRKVPRGLTSSFHYWMEYRPNEFTFIMETVHSFIRRTSLRRLEKYSKLFLNPNTANIFMVRIRAISVFANIILVVGGRNLILIDYV
jgi:hypothetical protein